MSVIDIFSRFLFFGRFIFLRPLQSRETCEEAEHLLGIYIEHDPAGILQSDQGLELKRVGKTACETFNVRVIKSECQ